VPYTFDVTDFGFSDSEDDQFKSVVIDSLPASGELQLSGVPVIAGQSIDSGLLGELIYLPVADFSGQPADSFRHRVVDDGGAESGGQDVALQHNTWSVDILAVNDAPAASGSSITTPEDSAYQFEVDDFGFSDVDDDRLSALVLTSLPSMGQLLLAGAPVSTGMSIGAEEVTDLTYLPAADTSGTDSFTYAVQDNGGTLNGGLDTSDSDNEIVLDVQGINDAPVLLLTDANFAEGSQNVFDEQFVSAVDPDDEFADLQLVLTGSPENGELLLDGLPLDAGDSFSLEQLSNGSVVYLHDGSETSFDTIGFSLQDGGEDGALPASAQFNITIDDVTDPPPELVDDEIVMSFGQVGLNVLSDGSTRVTDNDTFVSPDEHTITLETPPQHGVVTFNSDGSFVYDHDGSLMLNDSFSYRVTNVDNVSAVATVNVKVEPPLANAFAEPTANSVDSNVTKEPESEVEDTEVLDYTGRKRDRFSGWNNKPGYG